jgi:hypothetical protein
MLFGTLVAPALADGEQPEAGERDHPPEEGSASVIELLVIYPEPEAGSTHIDDISDDYGETTVDGYLSRLFEHVNQNYARSGIGAEFSLLPSMQVNMSHLDEDWKKQLSLAMMNPHNSPYVDYIEELDLISCEFNEADYHQLATTCTGLRRLTLGATTDGIVKGVCVAGGCMFAAPQASETKAWLFRSSRRQISRARAWVASRTTAGALPARKASCHRAAHRHHWLPGATPGKWYSGIGVLRSFPREREN